MQVETISEGIDNRGDYYEPSYVYFKEFPIPLDSNSDLPLKRRIESFVDQIIKNKEENLKADTKELEEEIDHLVYELYELSEEGD